MKNFIEDIQKSIYGPAYYQELLNRPTSFSWKYYTNLALVLALLVTIVSSISLVPGINRALIEFPQKFFSYYPDELEVKIVGGHATTTVPEPYYLPLPLFLQSVMGTSGDLRFLGVIDMKTPVSLEQFKNYQSFFWLSENALVVEDGGNVRVNMLDPTMNYTVNESNLRVLLTRAEPYFKFVAPVAVLLVFLAMVGAFILNLFYLIFAALLVFLLGKFWKKGWRYGTAYRIALHATTLPLLLSAMFSMVGLGAELPFFSTALLLLVVYLNFKQPASTATPPEPVTGA